jgi:hypothetical protein
MFSYGAVQAIERNISHQRKDPTDKKKMNKTALLQKLENRGNEETFSYIFLR